MSTPQQVLLVINPRINTIFELILYSCEITFSPKKQLLQFDEDVEVSNIMVICFVCFFSCMAKTL